ncbi:uncharacterized protein SCHCODRAFT_02634010 [Schizophyllum commune H4-8]|uniref:uncharacterized protein n=1 Tax=Schizophyllum commune (strain H4-8 / FGSC 9210) TaxID=578458 RepID=UPI002160E393|nr:uncharacterized protein SCHCODRAFT_02634010 [Schizophyllum commune H4-8]KAI5889256.1 hypothetical protein SCHCODRAFT_02634010 [Schizophyllum commune H4-8]
MCHPPRELQEIDPSIKSPESILPRPVPLPHPLSSLASTRRQFTKVDAENNPSSTCTCPSVLVPDPPRPRRQLRVPKAG